MSLWHLWTGIPFAPLAPGGCQVKEKVFAPGSHIVQRQGFCRAVTLFGLMFSWEWFLYGSGVDISHASTGQTQKRNELSGQVTTMVAPLPASGDREPSTARSLIFFVLKKKVRNSFIFKFENFPCLNVNVNYLKKRCVCVRGGGGSMGPPQLPAVSCAASASCQTGPSSTSDCDCALLE